MGAVRVRHAAPSAAEVRHLIEHELAGQGVSADSTDIVLLVASELIGNAVQHCRPATSDATLAVTWDVDRDHVTVRVDDPSSVLPRRLAPVPTDSFGRGLAIVEAMSDGWGVDLLPYGKQVWAHVPVQRRPALRSVELS